MLVPPVSVTDLVVQRVNGTRETVAPGASVPLCNAIFPTAITVQVRLRPRPGAGRVRLSVRYPQGVLRRHVVHVRARATHARVHLYAADERLPGASFAAGRHTFRVRFAGHRTATTLNFSGSGATC